MKNKLNLRFHFNHKLIIYRNNDNDKTRNEL